MSNLLTPLISYNSADSLKRAIQNSDLSYSFDEALFDRLSASGLPPLTSPSVLALILGISPKLITSMARTPARYYRRFTIPKKDGTERIIFSPRTFLKAVQYYILRFILRQQQISPSATGFVRGRGIIYNAKLHAGAPFILNVDLVDFFGTVKLAQVREVFLELGFPIATSDTLALRCTYNGALPQGAPTSPALSNMAFARIDEDIAGLSLVHQLTYSRYADDLTFSGVRPIPRTFLTNLEQRIRTWGFAINRKKTRFAGPNQARYVTGLVVNVHPQVDRQTRRKLRAMFHQAHIAPQRYSDRANELMGWASYFRSFDFARGQRYLQIARSIQQ